jgi:endonuclease YncB( thermonuclease family)
MPAVSAVLFCVVVGITDGDTLTARCDPAADVPAKTIKVRLAEVDAPEHHQPFRARSRENLSSLCVMQSTEVRPIAARAGLDRYGRTVAHVNCNGIDANSEQVRAGMAWVYPRYVTDRRLYALQDEARASRRGLWADAKPVGAMGVAARSTQRRASCRRRHCGYVVQIAPWPLGLRNPGRSDSPLDQP